MKLFIATCAVVLGLLAFEVQAEAKIEAAKPFASEQNFNLLKKLGSEHKSKLESDYLDGSGWNEDDYDDDYYDEDDEDYYDDDDYDDEFGSGDDQLLHKEKTVSQTESKAKVMPDHDDLHFKEEKKVEAEDQDILYEYYNELAFGDDEDDMEYLDEVEKDLSEVQITKNQDSEKSTNWNLQPSYIFLMLTSALITFAIVVLAFILCRKSMLSRQKNKKAMPFVISHGGVIQNQKSTPIVKNYQRVPTSTKELMRDQQPQMAEMGLSETHKPLLT